MREGRLELPLCRQSWILSPVRLPIPPLSPIRKTSPGQPTLLTLYPISLDTSIRDNPDIVNANSCIATSLAMKFSIGVKSGEYIPIWCDVQPNLEILFLFPACPGWDVPSDTCFPKISAAMPGPDRQLDVYRQRNATSHRQANTV